jgi:hypothetical protein
LSGVVGVRARHTHRRDSVLVDLRSRIAVMFDWFWSYLTYNRSMRLITGAEGSGD